VEGDVAWDITRKQARGLQMRAFLATLLSATAAMGMAAGTYAGSQPGALLGIKAVPMTRFPPSYGAHVPHGASVCKGAIPTNVTLEAISKTAADLEHGIACLSADFDGNGLIDYVLLSNSWIDGTETSDVLVVLAQTDGLARTIHLRGVSLFSFELYPARKRAGHFGEPVTSTPGLVSWGEGGSTVIWLFSGGAMTVSEHRSEDL
jgi:hypothetical protein